MSRFTFTPSRQICGRPPSPQPSPSRGEGANAGLRPPKPINDRFGSMADEGWEE